MQLDFVTFIAIIGAVSGGVSFYVEQRVIGKIEKKLNRIDNRILRQEKRMERVWGRLDFEYETYSPELDDGEN